MATTFHVSINIDGALKRMGKKSMHGLLCDDDGIELSDAEVRKYMQEKRTEGFKIILPSHCDNFDKERGCLGHK